MCVVYNLDLSLHVLHQSAALKCVSLIERQPKDQLR